MRTLLAALALCAGLAHAQTAPAPASAEETPVREHEAVVVTGVQPGPGLWKVRHGGNTLWILGTLTPLPKDFEWLSRDVEAVIGEADEVLGAPSLVVGSDIGFFRGLTLLPAAMKARNNPDGARLQDVLPPALYARWQPLKTRYFGNDDDIEKRRPAYAATELYEKAIRRAGLRTGGIVGPVVAKAAKRRGLKITPVQVKITIADPRTTLREFNRTPLNDIECFARMLDRVELDVATLRDRANAWAVGDIDALRAQPVPNAYQTCMNAFSETALAKKLGIGDPFVQVREAWVAQARKSLERNAVTFATLPMTDLLAPDGPLERLRALGYEIEAP